MLLTITTTHRPATDLGYLLHKNPARAQSFERASGMVIPRSGRFSSALKPVSGSIVPA